MASGPWRSARRRTSWTPRRRCRPTSTPTSPRPLFCETALAQVQDAQLSDSIDFFGGRKVTKAVAGLITVADWADHYSQMAIYLRLNGLLPPTAKKGMD